MKVVPTQSDIQSNSQRDLQRTTTDSSPISTVSITIWNKRAAPVATEVYESYWYFASERQKIFQGRVHGEIPPWSNDPILQAYKFTNAFRASDRTSQYLIGEVIYDDDWSLEDTVFRVLLFKLFNKIDTWQFLNSQLGPIAYSNFNWARCDRLLTAAIDSGARIYSAAYIMPSGTRDMRFRRKHRMHLALLKRMMRERVPIRLQDCRTMQEGYQLLLGFPSIGPFLAYQFITDINYSPHLNFDEMEFVVPGPGARDGLAKCFRDFSDYSEADIIRATAEMQHDAFVSRDLDPCTLFGRPLQLVDCQNLFCEIDKYARVAHPEIQGRTKRTRIKQRFAPASELPRPWYPPKWGINDAIVD